MGILFSIIRPGQCPLATGKSSSFWGGGNPPPNNSGPLKQQIISIKPMGAKMSLLPSILVIFFPVVGCMSQCWSLLLEGTWMRRILVDTPLSCPLHHSPFSSFSHIMFSASCFSYTFFPFQMLSYFQHDIFFLQLGRGWAAPRLIRVVWLYGPMWTHWRARTHTFDMDETRSQPMWINLTTLYARKDASQA